MRCPHCGSRISDTVAGELQACPVCKKGLSADSGDAVAEIVDDSPPSEASPASEAAKPKRPRVSGVTAKFDLDDDDPEEPPASPAQPAPANAKPAEGAGPSGPAPHAGPTSDASASGIPEKLGPYQVKRKLGEGGMGAVFEGYDPQLDRQVAIKVLASRLTQNEEFVQRFLVEARAIARVAHPNVAAVFSAGSEGAEHYFVMEFIEGESLDDRVERSGRLDPKTSIGYILQTVRGLAAAHERGIVHRDVKPANLMLGTDDKIKVTDFGLAKASGQDVKLTQAGAVMGSPHFMAPEQGRGEETDLRADVYSLGATLYFLLTGVPPYDGDSSLAIILKHQEAPVPQIKRAPPSLNRIVGKMMAKVVTDRYPTYDALMKDLVRLDRSGLLRDDLLQTTSGTVASDQAADAAPAAKTPVATPEPARPPGVRTTNLPTQKADDAAVLLSQLDAVMKKRPGKSEVLGGKGVRPGRSPGKAAAVPGMDPSSAGSEEGFEGHALSPTFRYVLVGGVAFLLLVLLSLSPWKWFKGGPAPAPGEDEETLEFIDKLRPLLVDASAGTRQATIRRISRLKGRTVRGLLIRALSDKSPDVRIEAVSALRRFDRKTVVPAVHRLLRDKSPDVRNATAAALEELTDYRFADDVDWARGSGEFLADEAARFMEWWRSR